MNTTTREVIWEPWGEPGSEHLRLEQRKDEIIADGIVIMLANDTPLRIHYVIQCDASWAVRQVYIHELGTVGARQRLIADGAGHWTRKPGGAIPSLDGCLDVDIAVTPFTNTLPIRHLGLQPGESAEINVVYFTIPQLHFRATRQRYTCLDAGSDGGRYRYEGLSSGYTTELEVDTDGLVIDYPEAWRRVWPR